MGEAREVMDRITTAVTETKDFQAAAECYSTDVVGVTPDQGEITGRDAIVEYLSQFTDSFSDLRYEYLAKHESGTWRSMRAMSSELTLRRCLCPRVREFRRPVSRSGCEAATS